MARRTRRRQRVLWYPTFGSPSWGVNGAGTGPRFAPTYGNISFANPPGGDTTSAGVQIGLTFDFPPEVEIAAGTAPSLSDFELSAWRLKRFVGKVHLWCNNSYRQDDQANITPVDTLVVASLIVRRVDAAGNALANFNFNTVNNVLAENVRDPFVWRRSWVLSEGAVTYADSPMPGDNQTRQPWAEANWQYGSVMDGPHIDTKSARLISSEERLFFEITAHATNWNVDPSGINVDVGYILDYRMVGVPARSTNRRNASR